jgi:3',5'-cyclic AMP phosphodiesterase CpdA
MLIMHHQPFPSGIPYLEEYRHFGADKIADAISMYSSVELILCGHVHRLMTARLGGVLAMSYLPQYRVADRPETGRNRQARLVHGAARLSSPSLATG